MPNITGTFGSYRLGDGGAFVTGAFYNNGQKYNTIAQHTSGSSVEFGFNASRSSSIYSGSDTVTPLSESTLYILKY